MSGLGAPGAGQHRFEPPARGCPHAQKRRGSRALDAAEAAFKAATKKPVDPPPKSPSLPGVKELVSLRMGQWRRRWDTLPDEDKRVCLSRDSHWWDTRWAGPWRATSRRSLRGASLFERSSPSEWRQPSRLAFVCFPLCDRDLATEKRPVEPRTKADATSLRSDF
jgi:hypothetical protein